METQHSQSLPEDPKHQKSFHQEPGSCHPSQSSQTYTNAPSGTGASAQSATATTEDFDPVAYEAAFAHDMQALSADVPHCDVQDIRLIGSWADDVDPQTDSFLRVNEPILSSIHRVGTTVDFAGNGTETTDCNGGESTEGGCRNPRQAYTARD